MKQKPFNEEEFIGASYITTFYEYVGQLTIAISEYKNLILEKKEEEEKTITKEQQEQLKQAINIVRKYVTITKIQYETIRESTEEAENNKITTIYDELNQKYIMKTETLEEYAKEMNKTLVSKKIKELLKTAQEKLNEIYRQQNTTLQH